MNTINQDKGWGLQNSIQKPVKENSLVTGQFQNEAEIPRNRDKSFETSLHSQFYNLELKMENNKMTSSLDI